MRKQINLKKEIEQNIRAIYDNKTNYDLLLTSVEKIINALAELGIKEKSILHFQEKVKTNTYEETEVENFITDVLIELKG